MSDTNITPPATTMTMAEVWAMVEITPSDAVNLLNALAESNADRSPTLVTSLHNAIDQVLNGSKTEPATQETTLSY